MTRGFRSINLALGILAVGLTCDGGAELLAPEPCPDDAVTLTARMEPPLEFVWTPACPVAWLEVYDDASNASAWVVTGRGDNVIRPIVRYGRLPGRAVQLVAPAALTPGRTYVVRVLRLVGDPGGPQALIPAGSATFTL